MKRKTSDLIGLALDWAVGKADGCDLAPVEYSTKWEFGGPLIEREGGTLWSTNACGWRCKAKYDYVNDKEGVTMSGPTPLIAAMRCFVASKLGEEVDIPEELS